MNEEPIYDFNALREFLVHRGYIVEQAQGYRPFTPEVIDPMEEIRRGTMEFRDNGIFVIHPETEEEQQIFLYKYDYRLAEYGKPRFHICKCKTIKDFIDKGLFRGHYVRANTDPVPVQNIDNDNREEMVSELPLCKNCLQKIREYGNINTSQFVEILREVNGVEDIEQQEEVEVDIRGYTREWEQISRAYREAHEYTCEKCGLRIDDTYDRQFIHCHHKDSNKLNNNENNLECLCLRCHSEVDDYHRLNLTTGANGIIFDDFNSKYPLDNIESG